MQERDLVQTIMSLSESQTLSTLSKKCHSISSAISRMTDEKKQLNVRTYEQFPLSQSFPEGVEIVNFHLWKTTKFYFYFDFVQVLLGLFTFVEMFNRIFSITAVKECFQRKPNVESFNHVQCENLWDTACETQNLCTMWDTEIISILSQSISPVREDSESYWIKPHENNVITPKVCETLIIIL